MMKITFCRCWDAAAESPPIQVSFMANYNLELFFSNNFLLMMSESCLVTQSWRRSPRNWPKTKMTCQWPPHSEGLSSSLKTDKKALTSCKTSLEGQRTTFFLTFLMSHIPSPFVYSKRIWLHWMLNQNVIWVKNSCIVGQNLKNTH